MNDHWSKLSFDSLREFYNLDRSLVPKGQTIDSLTHFIGRKLKKINYLEECHIQTQQNSLNKDENEFTAENKLYVRGLRERSGKAASEALEKITYKDKCEEYYRKMQYENRGKKKSPEELETNELLNRPFRFISGKASIPRKSRRSCCRIGEQCGLCCGMYATCIVTAEEIDEAGGDIVNALPIDFCNKKRKDIRHLGFWPISDAEIPNDRDESEKEPSKLRSRRSKGRSYSSDKAWMEYWKLMEMKQSMAFVNEYNKGLFQQNNTKK